MTQRLALHTLVELAEKESSQLAIRLSAAVRAHQEQAQKLTLLLQYREDYAQRYEQGLSSGLGITHHQNFRDFLYRLDEAIDGQRLLANQAESQALVERNAWQDAERKRLSFDTLVQRAQQQQQQMSERRDQKANDEFATRMTAVKMQRAASITTPDE